MKAVQTGTCTDAQDAAMSVHVHTHEHTHRFTIHLHTCPH